MKYMYKTEIVTFLMGKEKAKEKIQTVLDEHSKDEWRLHKMAFYSGYVILVFEKESDGMEEYYGKQ